MTIYYIKNNQAAFTYFVNGINLTISEIKFLIKEKYSIDVNVYNNIKMLDDEYIPFVDTKDELCTEELFLQISNRLINNNSVDTKTITFYKIDNNTFQSKVINVPTHFIDTTELNTFLVDKGFLQSDKYYSYYLGNELITTDNFNNIFEHTVKIINKN